MKHVIFLLVLLAAYQASGLNISGLSAADAKQPNVLFVMVDEMRADAVGAAKENNVYETPALDKLASQGTRFSQAYTVAAVCVASRYSFFTSRYSHVHGAVQNNLPIKTAQILLPSLLKHLGYETAISGKLHFSPNDADYDFDYYWSFSNDGPHKLQTWIQYIGEKYKNEQSNIARKTADNPFPGDALGGDIGKLTYPKEDTQSSWITDRALEFFDKRNKEKPFFLFVSYLEPHSPSHLTEPYWSKYEEEKKNVALSPTFVAGKKDPNPLRRNGRVANNPDKSQRHWVSDPEIAKAMTAAYHIKVKAVDDNIERLLAGLQKAGLDKDTLIIFTADHGNMTADHNRWFKGVAYEGSTKIPLIIKAPESSPYSGKFNTGKVVPQLVESIDVYPTILDFIGKTLPKDNGWQGTSLTQLLNNPLQWKDTVYSECRGKFVRTGKYKLIKQDETLDGGKYELYDIESDPLETKNLVDDAALKSTLDELKAKLAAWEKSDPAVPKYPGLEPRFAGETPKPNPNKQKQRQQQREGGNI